MESKKGYVIDIVNTSVETVEEHDTKLLDEVKAGLHEIYACDLYCYEEYCQKDEYGYNCVDCFNKAVADMLNRMKAEVSK